MTYRVSLTIPDCDGDTPADAVESFLAQASQIDLWEYRVEEEVINGSTFVVDRAENNATREVAA